MDNRQSKIGRRGFLTAAPHTTAALAGTGYVLTARPEATKAAESASLPYRFKLGMYLPELGQTFDKSQF